MGVVSIWAWAYFNVKRFARIARTLAKEADAAAAETFTDFDVRGETSKAGIAGIAALHLRHEIRAARAGGRGPGGCG